MIGIYSETKVYCTCLLCYRLPKMVEAPESVLSLADRISGRTKWCKNCHARNEPKRIMLFKFLWRLKKYRRAIYVLFRRDEDVV